MRNKVLRVFFTSYRCKNRARPDAFGPTGIVVEINTCHQNWRYHLQLLKKMLLSTSIFPNTKYTSIYCIVQKETLLFVC